MSVLERQAELAELASTMTTPELIGTLLCVERSMLQTVTVAHMAHHPVAGNLAVWLAALQVLVIPLTEREPHEHGACDAFMLTLQRLAVEVDQ